MRTRNSIFALHHGMGCRQNINICCDCCEKIAYFCDPPIITRRSRLFSRHFEKEQIIDGIATGDPTKFAWNNWGRPRVEWPKYRIARKRKRRFQNGTDVGQVSQRSTLKLEEQEYIAFDMNLGSETDVIARKALEREKTFHSATV